MSEYNPAFPGMLNCENVRFTDVNVLSTEQALFDSYWKELINLYGVGLNYQVHRYDKTKADNLYGEHSSQEYADPVQILGLIDLQENALSLSKYGFVTDDQITLYLHIQTYTDIFEPLGIYQEVNQKYIAPKAGDIFEMYEFGKTRPLGLGGKKFIVTERTDQDVGMNINQLAGHYVWVVKAKRYDPSYESNVDEENESYQIFDDDYTGRLEDNVEVNRNPSEQKQYNYSAQQENLDKVFNYNKEMINTNVYGGYLKLYSVNRVQEMSWYATTETIESLSLQKSRLIDDQYFQCIFQPEYGSDFKQSIKIPSIYKLTKVDIYNKVIDEWQTIGGNAEYSKTLFDVKKVPTQIDGDIYSYNEYTYNGPIVGERSARFYVEPLSGVIRDDVDPYTLPWFATVKNDDTFTKLTTLPQTDDNGNKYYHTFLAAENAEHKQAVKISSDLLLDYVEIYNKITDEWSIIGNSKEYSVSLFTPDDEIMQINGEIFKYTTYTYNGPRAGERELKFYIKTPDMKFYTAPTSGLVLDVVNVSELPWYATIEGNGTFTKLSIMNPENKTDYYECTLAREVVDEYGNITHRQSIQIPKQCNLEYIEMWNIITRTWDIIGGKKEYSITTFDKTDCDKEDYFQYTFNGSAVGQRQLRFHITAVMSDVSVTTETIDVDDLPWYATSDSITVFTPQSNDQFIKGEFFECLLQAETNTFKQAIQIPASYNIEYIKLFNQHSNKWIFIGSKEQSLKLFDVKYINKTINDKTIAYKQYTHNGDKTGERILRFYIK